MKRAATSLLSILALLGCGASATDTPPESDLAEEFVLTHYSGNTLPYEGVHTESNYCFEIHGGTLELRRTGYYSYEVAGRRNRGCHEDAWEPNTSHASTGHWIQIADSISFSPQTIVVGFPTYGKVGGDTVRIQLKTTAGTPSLTFVAEQ